MAGDPPELIACEDCGCLNERATALLAQAKGDLERAERDLRAKRARIAKLESDASDKLRHSPHYEAALDVLRHWSHVCLPNAKEVDSIPRLTAVLARISGGHSPEELKLAADGYAKLPYVTPEGRSAHGTKRQWFADAELIFRSAEHVRKGIAYAASPGSSDSSPTTQSVERLSWRTVMSANRRLIVRALTEKYGKPNEDTGLLTPGVLLFPCPKCERTGKLPSGKTVLIESLRVYPQGSGRVAECWNCGLDELRLIAAITEDSDAQTSEPGGGVSPGT